MIKLALRFALPLFVVLTTALLATHARSVDSSMRPLLDPSAGCSGSDLCFMGIRPGATPIREAIDMLRAHPWVANVLTRPPFAQASWTWSGAQPDYIDSGVPGTLRRTGDSYVSLIQIRTHYSYGDLWLQLGTPQTGYTWRQPSALMHGSYYPAYSLLAINYLACPTRLFDFWRMPVIVQFGDAVAALDSRYAEQSARDRTC